MRETLAAWGDADIVRPLSGGNRNAVTEIRLDGRRLVARRSRRRLAAAARPPLDHRASYRERGRRRRPSRDASRCGGRLQACVGRAGRDSDGGGARRPGPGQHPYSPAGAGLLDWDEARRDHTDLDLVELPGALLPPARQAVASRAAAAWEAANGWLVEPSYARRQLATLRAMR